MLPLRMPQTACCLSQNSVESETVWKTRFRSFEVSTLVFLIFSGYNKMYLLLIMEYGTKLKPIGFGG